MFKKIFNKTTLLHIYSVIGLICTIKLAVIYYQSNYNLYALPSFCSINKFIDCDGIAQTSTAVFLGIPLAYWGMFFYTFVLLILNADKIKNIKFLKCFEVFKTPFAYISVLGIFSFFISILLALISIFKIKKLCILCVFTYFLNLLIGITATDIKNGGFITDVKTSIKDFLEGLKNYKTHFFISVILFSVFISYTTINMPFASRKESINHYLKMKTNPFKTTGNTLGNPDGKIEVHLFSDFGCPICPTYNIMIHQLVREDNKIKVIPHQFPLDKECNYYLNNQMHEGGCRMARYVIASENQGKYWDMAEMLFENKPKNDIEAVELAKKINLDIEQFKKDINSTNTKNKLQNDITNAISKGIDGTPTILINGRIFFGAKSYHEFKTLILKDKNE